MKTASLFFILIFVSVFSVDVFSSDLTAIDVKAIQKNNTTLLARNGRLVYRYFLYYENYFLKDSADNLNTVMKEFNERFTTIAALPQKLLNNPVTTVLSAQELAEMKIRMTSVYEKTRSEFMVFKNYSDTVIAKLKNAKSNFDDISNRESQIIRSLDPTLFPHAAKLNGANVIRREAEEYEKKMTGIINRCNDDFNKATTLEARQVVARCNTEIAEGNVALKQYTLDYLERSGYESGTSLIQTTLDVIDWSRSISGVLESNIESIRENTDRLSAKMSYLYELTENTLEAELNARLGNRINEFLKQYEYTIKKEIFFINTLKNIKEIDTGLEKYIVMSLYFKAERAYKNYLYAVEAEIAKVDTSFLTEVDRKEIKNTVRDIYLSSAKMRWDNTVKFGATRVVTALLSRVNDVIKRIRDDAPIDKKQARSTFETIRTEFIKTNYFKDCSRAELVIYETKLEDILNLLAIGGVQ